jgi:hypothetical protein
MDGHVGPKPRYPRFQIVLDHDGVRRVTDVPLKDIDIVRLAHEAAVQNLGMAQLLTHAVTTTIKKEMIDEILCGPSQEAAPQVHPENSLAPPSGAFGASLTRTD